MTKLEALETAITEAKRFIAKAEFAASQCKWTKHSIAEQTAERRGHAEWEDYDSRSWTAAKRASLDLTMAVLELRKA